MDRIHLLVYIYIYIYIYICSGRISALRSVVAGSISSGGDHGIHWWWDLIRSKQLSSVSVCHTQVFARFSGQGNSIHNIYFFGSVFFWGGSIYLFTWFRYVSVWTGLSHAKGDWIFTVLKYFSCRTKYNSVTINMCRGEYTWKSPPWKQWKILMRYLRWPVSLKFISQHM